MISGLSRFLIGDITCPGEQGTITEDEDEDEAENGEQLQSDMEFEEWYGIQEDESEVQDSGDEVVEDIESDKDGVMEDGDVDVLDSEEFVGDNGEVLQKEEIMQGLGVIWERHWKKIEKDMDLFEHLGKQELGGK